VANFPALDAEACVARKGDIGNSVRFRAFLRVTESDRIGQKPGKRAQDGARTRKKTTEKRVFHDLFY